MMHVVMQLRKCLSNHPDYGTCIAFIASFSEAIPLLGSIVPGSMIMLGVGMLIGSGMLQIDRTLFSGFIGAISGDIASFFFGYFFFKEIKKYKLYTKLRKYIVLMESMLTRYTITTTIVGRFVGPARSALPFVAGTMFINPLIFLPVSIATSCVWVFLYTLPGIFAGVTGSTIPPEITIKYFILGIISGFFSSIIGYFTTKYFSKKIYIIHYGIKNIIRDI